MSLHGASRQIRTSPHSRRHRAGRVLWSLVHALLFRPSPRPMHGWRRWLLRSFGARLHGSAKVYPRARIWAPWNLVMEEGTTIADDVDVYCVDCIHLEPWSAVSQYSYLCGATHDFEDDRFPLVPKPIRIGARAWIAADVFIGPGAVIGEGAVVGARSSVYTSVPPWMVCAGNPARPLRPRRRDGQPAETPDEP